MTSYPFVLNIKMFNSERHCQVHRPLSCHNNIWDIVNLPSNPHYVLGPDLFGSTTNTLFPLLYNIPHAERPES